MDLATPCPDPQQLRHFLLGQLPEDRSGQLEQHLLTCTTCLQAAEALHMEDALINAMRLGARMAAQPLEAPIEGLLARLHWILDFELSQPSQPTGEPGTPLQSETPAGQEASDDAAQKLLAPPSRPGDLGQLGPYRVLKVLGAGGMGVVFHAEDPQLQRSVALKVLNPALLASPRARRRFLREAQAAAAVEHDHIVPIYQVGEDRGIPFLAMQLLQGETLEQRLLREQLSLAEVLRIGREIAIGLAATHARGLLHRDIKPANVWLEVSPPSLGARVGEGRKDRVKLLDFGLAQTPEAVASGSEPDLEFGGHSWSGVQLPTLTQGTALGTPTFMAPEQMIGGMIDHRCDLFSLGCVLYVMATGRLPFPGGTITAALVAAAMTEPPAPHELVPGLPLAFSQLIQQLLAPDPAARPASAQAVVEAIAFLEAVAETASETRGGALARGFPIFL